MLTQPSAPATPDAASQPRSLDDLIAYFEGDWVPMRDAKVSIMTHAFMYGTATFEGIRATGTRSRSSLYALFVREHVERIRHSAKILLMEPVPSADELVSIILETVRRNHFREDVYIRPSFYKSTRAIGVRLHHLDHRAVRHRDAVRELHRHRAGRPRHDLVWRRNADEALPARGKIVGGYVNMAFQKSEAELNGFDEALVLTPDGHASEASAANLFIVRDGTRCITPPLSDDILEGVTRKAVMASWPRTRASPSDVRSIDRSELYVCDEVFLCGTGVQVSPVIEVDHRPVGTGGVGPIGAPDQRALLRGRARQPARVPDWLTPIEG